MLNIFPIQFLAPFAYFFLRVCLGCILIVLGVRHLKSREELALSIVFPSFPFPRFIVIWMSIIELCAGALLVMGFLTQLGALLVMALSLKLIVFSTRFTHPSIPSRMFYTLLFFSSLSLLITGAGIFAFDLPL